MVILVFSFRGKYDLPARNATRRAHRHASAVDGDVQPLRPFVATLTGIRHRVLILELVGNVLKTEDDAGRGDDVDAMTTGLLGPLTEDFAEVQILFEES
jgi:hypothetical protein